MGNGQVEGIGAASRLICKDAAGNAIHADARPIGDHAQAMAAVLAILGERFGQARVTGSATGWSMAGSISLLPR